MNVEVVVPGEVWLGRGGVERRLKDEVCKAKAAAPADTRREMLFWESKPRNSALFAAPVAANIAFTARCAASWTLSWVTCRVACRMPRCSW